MKSNFCSLWFDQTGNRSRLYRFSSRRSINSTRDRLSLYFVFAVVPQENDSCRESKVPEYHQKQSRSTANSLAPEFASPPLQTQESDESIRQHPRERHESGIGDPEDRQLLTPDLNSLQPTFNDVPTDFFFDDNADKLSFKLNQQPDSSGQLQLTLAESKFINQPHHQLQNGSELTDFSSTSHKPIVAPSKSLDQSVYQFPQTDDSVQDQEYDFRSIGRKSYDKLLLEKGRIAQNQQGDENTSGVVANGIQKGSYSNSLQSNNHHFCQQIFSHKNTVIPPFSGEVVGTSAQPQGQPHGKSISEKANDYSARNNSNSIPYRKDGECFKFRYPSPHYHQYGHQNDCYETINAYANRRLSYPYDDDFEPQTPNWPENYSPQQCRTHFSHSTTLPSQDCPDMPCPPQQDNTVGSNCSACHHASMLPHELAKTKQIPDDTFVFRHPTNPVPVPTSTRRMSHGNFQDAFIIHSKLFC